MLLEISPETFLGSLPQQLWSTAENFFNGEAYVGTSMGDLEKNNKNYRKSAVDMMKGQNLGDLPDWYFDAKFAQQSFTSANPCTVRLASHEWIARFKRVARVQKTSAASDFIDQIDQISLFFFAGL